MKSHILKELEVEVNYIGNLVFFYG